MTLRKTAAVLGITLVVMTGTGTWEYEAHDVAASDLERGELPLEESLALYEEGIKLSRFCHAKLEEAEAKIELLMKDAKGAVEQLEQDIDDIAGAFEKVHTHRAALGGFGVQTT